MCVFRVKSENLFFSFKEGAGKERGEGRGERVFQKEKGKGKKMFDKEDIFHIFISFK